MLEHAGTFSALPRTSHFSRATTENKPWWNLRNETLSGTETVTLEDATIWCARRKRGSFYMTSLQKEVILFCFSLSSTPVRKCHRIAQNGESSAALTDPLKSQSSSNARFAFEVLTRMDLTNSTPAIPDSSTDAHKPARATNDPWDRARTSSGANPWHPPTDPPATR